MSNHHNSISLRAAAIIAGIGYLLMNGTPFAEFYVFPKLIVDGKLEETAKNIIANEGLFRMGIVGYLVTFIGDVLAAWALYILLKPVNESLSKLTAWFRIVYTLVSLAALLNLVNVLQVLKPNHFAVYSTVFTPGQLYAQVDFLLGAFKWGWSIAYIFFAIHLWLLGYLIFKSNYIPKFIGIWLIAAGVCWMFENLRPFLFPDFHINFMIILLVGFGELVFMFWLFIKGSRLKEFN